MIIELKMKITPEFILELAQYGIKVKITAPIKLKKYFLVLHKNAIEVLVGNSTVHLCQEEFLLKNK